MGKMGGGAATSDPDLDDWNVRDDETVWRLIDPQYFVDDPSIPDKKIIKVGSFSHNKKGVSFLRPGPSVTVAFVQANFPGFGIAAIKAADIRKLAGCLFVVENDPTFPWPKDAHLCVYKAQLKNRLKPWQCSKLVELAEQNLILAPSA
jgi:hypothetical protein